MKLNVKCQPVSSIKTSSRWWLRAHTLKFILIIDIYHRNRLDCAQNLRMAIMLIRHFPYLFYDTKTVFVTTDNILWLTQYQTNFTHIDFQIFFYMKTKRMKFLDGFRLSQNIASGHTRCFQGGFRQFFSYS